MAVTPNSIITPQAFNVGVQNFVQGADSAGTFKTIFTAGANGSKLTGIMVASDDGSATHVLTLVLTRSATNYYLGAYTLPVNSGTDGAAPAVDMLNGGPAGLIPGLPIDNDGQRYLPLISGDVLKLTFATALTSGKRIDVVSCGGDL